MNVLINVEFCLYIKVHQVFSQPLKFIKYKIYCSFVGTNLVTGQILNPFAEKGQTGRDFSVKFSFSDGWANMFIYLNSHKRWLFLLFLSKITFNTLKV